MKSFKIFENFLKDNGVFPKCNGTLVNLINSAIVTKSMVSELGPIEDHICDLLVESLRCSLKDEKSPN